MHACNRVLRRRLRSVGRLAQGECTARGALYPSSDCRKGSFGSEGEGVGGKDEGEVLGGVSTPFL